MVSSYAGNTANFVTVVSNHPDPWILQTVQGYHLEFENTPFQFKVPSKVVFSKEQSAAIDTEAAKLLGKGAIMHAERTEGEFISNLILVPKKTYR